MKLVKLMLVVLFLAAFLAPVIEAEAKVVSIEGVSYNVNASVGDNVKMLVGKKVYVSLNSGQTYAGVIKIVGSQLVHLEKIEARDFNDALIRLKDIIAIDTAFRKFE